LTSSENYISLKQFVYESAAVDGQPCGVGERVGLAGCEEWGEMGDA